MKGRIATVFLIVAVVAQASWRSESTKESIPSTPVKGKLLDSNFAPNFVSLKSMGFNRATENGKVKDRAQSWILTFAGDNGFIPDSELAVWFSTEPGKPIDGQSIIWKPYVFGTEESRKQSYGNRQGTVVPRGITGVFTSLKKSNGGVKSSMYSDRITARIQFEKMTKGVIRGQIFLALPDKGQTVIAGTFQATMKS